MEPAVARGTASADDIGIMASIRFEQDILYNGWRRAGLLQD